MSMQAGAWLLLASAGLFASVHTSQLHCRITLRLAKRPLDILAKKLVIIRTWTMQLIHDFFF